MTANDNADRQTAVRAQALRECLCPLTRLRCLGDSCMWYVSYAAGAKGCAATHVADALIEVAYQLTLV